MARRAGVSIATAYRVVKQSAPVSPEREARVRRIAQELGIQVGYPATRNLAFLLGNRPTLHAFHSQVLIGAAARCAENGYGVQFFPLDYPPTVPARELRMPVTLQGRGLPDGFIAAGTNSESLLEWLTEVRRPFAVLGNNMLGEWRRDGCDVIWMDLTGTSYQMTKYLLSLGHRHLWFVQHGRFPWVVQCFEGYSQAMKEAKLAPRSSDFFSDNEREAGYLAMKSLLAHGEPVTAVFAATDHIALGIYDVLRESRLRIPEEVSVVGVGNRPEAAALYPPLSTLWGFPEQVGRQLAQLVLNRLAVPDLPWQRIVIPTQFIKRDSCHQIGEVSRRNVAGANASSIAAPVAAAG